MLCSVLWVADPNETGFFVRLLLKDIARKSWDERQAKQGSRVASPVPEGIK